MSETTTTPPPVDQTTTTTPAAAPSKQQAEVKPVPHSHLQHLVDSSLISFLDRQVCVYTLDGSMFVGELNGFDSVNGVTLTNVQQRWVHDGTFAEREIPGAMYLAGVNVLMVGSRDDKYLNDLTEVPVEELLRALKAQNVANPADAGL